MATVCSIVREPHPLMAAVTRQAAAMSEDEGVRLPPLNQPAALSRGASCESLVHQLGLVDINEKSLGHLLNTIHCDVQSALEESRTITTHDNNLEKQYKETVAENIKLKASLDRARREITHLKGRLSVLELTSSDIREERVRQLSQQRRLEHQESQLQQRSRVQGIEELVQVLSFAERSRTVDSRGRYIESSISRRRTRTYPPPPPLPASTCKKEPLPPPLSGCSCSVCTRQQSLGAVTLDKALRLPPQLLHTKSGQQILQGDRVIVKGEQPGTVKYIGKLDFDPFNRVYIGVHLDAPVGNCDGMVKGRRYFQSPPTHGVFVVPHEVLCVTGRKPRTVTTVAPRMRPAHQRKPISSKANSDRPSPYLDQTPLHSPSPTSYLLQAQELAEDEMTQLLEQRDALKDLVNPSVSNMADQMTALKQKPKHLPTVPEVTLGSSDQEQDDDEDSAEQQHTDHEEVDTATDAQLILEQQQAVATAAKDQELVGEPATPQPTMEQLVDDALIDKDLGNTGFVTVRELKTALHESAQLTVEQIDEVVATLGLQEAEGRGIEYTGLATTLVETIKRLSSNPIATTR